MKSEFHDIDKTLDIEVTPIEETKIVKKPKPIPKARDRGQESEKDYEYTRSQLYSLIEKGQEAVNGILELSQESDSPRAYEVAGQLIKSVADATDKLIDLQQKMKDLNKEDPKGPNSVTNNALFIGSTADLQKFLKNGGQGEEQKK
ncbi:MAG: terminase [Candidatus Marinimicrobia bacterium]|jgi:hypothetical protein|nr:terminase [Candidatus Neomarinimicrobiota bacterium]|tara:strand:- start:713 stop:1150 length:438 start_codon:yes stop_codon:yes gene_type:complete